MIARRPEHLTAATPLLGLPGVGPSTSRALEEHGLRTLGDVLEFVPQRWDDLRAPRLTRDLEPGAGAAVCARVIHALRFTPDRGGEEILRVECLDEEQGQLAVLFFKGRRTAMEQALRPGTTHVFISVPSMSRGMWTMPSPRVLAVDAPLPGVVAVYQRVTCGSGKKKKSIDKLVRSLVALACGVTGAPEPVPAAVLARAGLLGWVEALRALHQHLEE